MHILFIRLGGNTIVLAFKKNMSIQFKRCSSSADVPKRAHVGSAGYGTWSAEKVALKPWDREFVLIDLKIAIPEGYYGRWSFWHCKKNIA